MPQATKEAAPQAPFWPAALAAVLGAVYMAAFLAGESQAVVFGLLVGGLAAVLGAGALGWLRAVAAGAQAHSKAFGALMTAATAAVCLYFYEDPFVLFLVASVLVIILTCLGLNIQFGYVGVVNFAGASFLGVGCYTAALLADSGIPHLLLLPLGGVMAALLGCVLLVPVLKTRGHYAALVTIAFALLYKTFLEVNDTLGGPQGLRVPSLNIMGWDFNNDIIIGAFEGSFYLGYLAVILALVVLGFGLARRLEDSWAGLSMDAVRLDEVTAACFGLSVPRWKITAFTLGNFYCGVAGAFYAMLLGYIAPSNFAFSDSLILLSIVILGGLGSMWGAVAASVIVIVLPEKFQIIQEYRFLLYAVLVIAILLFRPQGLLPRPLRSFASLR